MKMKLLPKFVFLFRSVALRIYKKVITDIQGIINNFLWAGQKTRIKASFFTTKEARCFTPEYRILLSSGLVRTRTTVVEPN